MAVVLARAAASLGADRRAPSGRARRTAARRARVAAAQQDAVQGAPYEPQEPGRTPGCAGNNFDPVCACERVPSQRCARRGAQLR